MRAWGTTIHALNPVTGEYCEYSGPVIFAPSRELAFEYCQKNGLGYCNIEDELIMTITDEGESEDFTIIHNN